MNKQDLMLLPKGGAWEVHQVLRREGVTVTTKRVGYRMSFRKAQRLRNYLVFIAVLPGVLQEGVSLVDAIVCEFGVLAPCPLPS